MFLIFLHETVRPNEWSPSLIVVAVDWGEIIFIDWKWFTQETNSIKVIRARVGRIQFAFIYKEDFVVSAGQIGKTFMSHWECAHAQWTTSIPCVTWPFWKICSCAVGNSCCNITFTTWPIEHVVSYKAVDSFCLPHVTSFAFIRQFSFQVFKQMTVAVISLDLLKAQSKQTVMNSKYLLDGRHLKGLPFQRYVIYAGRKPVNSPQ